MKVLHILNDVTDRGNGIVNTAVDLAMEQARLGMTVAVASAGGGYKPLLERAGVTHLTLDQSRRPGRVLRAFVQFRRQLREFQPDVVHAHMRTGLLLAWVWRRFFGFSLIGHVHNVHDRESVMMGLADRVIAVSESVAKTMAQSGIAPAKIRVVLNRTLGSRRQLALAEVEPAQLEHPAIVTVGGMNYRKGIEELLAAFETVSERFPDAHLYMVGDGPERELFEAHAARLKSRARVHFEGFKALPQAYMLSADVFVLASRRESFGLVLIEAREAGCAIVATDVDGIAEALDGGNAGILVEPRNPPALAEALCRMIGDEAERQEWQQRARHGIANYQVQVMATEVKSVYQELIKTVNWQRTSDVALSK
jgi:glycosyltransferase involved in cell wall biosynthesis